LANFGTGQGVTILAAGVAVAALTALCRCGRRARRAVTKTRLHVRAALLAGRELTGTGALALDATAATAVCGRCPI
jgi:antitoxin (DNA-binding transcriptional repressor) of toxin-antitoxin stability system